MANWYSLCLTTTIRLPFIIPQERDCRLKVVLQRSPPGRRKAWGVSIGWLEGIYVQVSPGWYKSQRMDGRGYIQIDPGVCSRKVI